MKRLFPLLFAPMLASVPSIAAATAPARIVPGPLPAAHTARVHRKTASTQLTNIVVLIAPHYPQVIDGASALALFQAAVKSGRLTAQTGI